MIVYKNLEDLNLIDSYLFSRSTEKSQNAKLIAKMIIERAMGRIIKEVKIETEKSLQGVDFTRHGIRMDLCITEYEGGAIVNVYDIEPNKYDVKELPRRSRYSQSLTDVTMLPSGKRYRCLPEYVSIWILTDDPFGKNKMVYTVKNTVENYPDIEYNDGVTKMFLYVDGEADGNKKLKELLQFFKSSKKPDTTDEELRLLHEIVEDVKKSHDERMRYMTWQDYLEYETEEARKESFAEGEKCGIQQGMVRGMIITLREMNVSEDEIKQKIMEKYQLTEDKAQEYLSSNL